jgi:hypothetical protein
MLDGLALRMRLSRLGVADAVRDGEMLSSDVRDAGKLGADRTVPGSWPQHGIQASRSGSLWRAMNSDGKQERDRDVEIRNARGVGGRRANWEQTIMDAAVHGAAW